MTTSESGSTSNSKSQRPLTPVEAITKISKILAQLAPSDRKRVLVFLGEDGSVPTAE